MPDPPPDFLPTASIETLRLRARLLKAVREFFDARGYFEVETPTLSHDVVVDPWLDPFVAHWEPEGGDRAVPKRALYLQTSPEFGMKRLLAAGADAIYQVTRAYRNGEVGRHHNPEFTMIEWYRVGDTHREQMDVVEQLVRHVAGGGRRAERAGPDRILLPSPPGRGVGGEGVRSCRDAVSNPPSPDTEDSRPPLALSGPQPSALSPQALLKPFQRLSYYEAFERFAGTRVLALSPQELAAWARERGCVPPPGLAEDDRDGWLNFLLAEYVEPALHREPPTFIYDYPDTQAALAQIRRDTPPVAERFELYIGGVEVCNGYHELTDAEELGRRMARNAATRTREGRRDLPLENRLLDAMQHGLPPCSGVALGFDRLVMLLLGAETLADVMTFPFDRA